MSKLGDYVLRYNWLTTSITMRAFGQACDRASRLQSFINNLIVTKSGYDGLCHNNISTSITMRAFCKTCFKTGGSKILINHHMVAKSTNKFLCNQNFSAYRTIYFFCVSCLKASDCCRHHCFKVARLDFLISCIITSCTSVILIPTDFCAGMLLRIVVNKVMSKCIYNFLWDKNLSASITV